MDDALRRVEDALARTKRVTLTGEPGVGKSHLARALGAPIIACAEIRDAEGFFRRIATYFDRSDESLEALEREIATLPRVVLDDVDRVPLEALETLARLAPDTEMVWTSRSRLALPDEHLVELRPLSTEAAMALFDELARRVRGQPIRDDEQGDVRALVQALDGNPAALELAASRLRVLAPRALRHRLSEPLRVLRDTATGSSLETLVAWSWDALDDAQQRALAALATFAGEFGVDDAEAMLGDDGQSLDRLAALRDRSLVVSSGSAELRVPRVVRAYVRDRAQLPFARLAQLLTQRLGESNSALDGDLMSVLQHVADAELVDRELASAAVELAIAATPRIAFRGPYEAFLRVLDPVVEVSVRSGAPAALQARAFLSRARVRGDERDVLAAASIAEKIGDEALKLESSVALAETRRDPSLLPAERPDDPLGHRWDWVRCSSDVESARRLAASEAPFLAARAHGELGDWRNALRLAERDRDDAFRATAIRHLLDQGALKPDEVREALTWADESQLDELADALRTAHPAADVLRIDAKGFTLGSLHVSLERRHALRRIVHALATGDALDWSALLEAGWPGEQVRAESGAHRVRVAVSTLRKLGLSPLMTVEDGYQLDPKTPVDHEL